MRKSAVVFRTVLLLTFFSFFLFGCAKKELVHYEIPPDLRSGTARQETIQKYSPFLSGKKIFLDPGHGGTDRRGKGNLKMVVEADINLSVALALREYLQQAGAVVMMSRVGDTPVDLKERSEMANRSDADIFISIHHNAPGRDSDDWINYTSTYYHATEKDYEFEPCQRDMARYVQRDLAYVMDNPGGLGSFDGTYSDYNIYPKEGFSVLRRTKKPAILLECGFFTNNFEERRLAKEEYNRIQAWGIFRGLGRYFKSGIPTITQLESDKGVDGETELRFALKDKSGIDARSIRTFVDSVETSFYFNENDGTLTIRLTADKAGEREIRIICANKNGNHAFPYHKVIAL